MTIARRPQPGATLVAHALACCIAVAGSGGAAMAAGDTGDAGATAGQDRSGAEGQGQARLSDADAHAVREVVQGQIEAMATDDDARAFSFASPSVRNLFHDAPSFMLMVRHGYPMLIRPTSTLYLRPEAIEGGAVLVVHVVDHDGESWLATYQMQRQPDRSWRIDGCVVAPDDQQEST